MSLETDDGFYNIKATGDPQAVTKVFQKLNDSMGCGAKQGGAGGAKQAGVPSVAMGPNADQITATATANAVKEAANEAKVKAKEEELNAKKKADTEKLENDKKKAKEEADEKVKKAK